MVGNIGAPNSVVIASVAPRKDVWVIPTALGLPMVAIPPNWRAAPELAEVGRALFFAQIGAPLCKRNLSASKTISCASCYDPTKAFSNPLTRGIGIDGPRTLRKTPSLLNVAFKPTLLWDGLASTLGKSG
jgi:cytochrome c peroxidase